MHWTFSNTVPLGSFFILINATGCIRKNMDITKSSIEHSVQQSMWKNFRWSNKTRIELLDEVFKRIQCAFDSNKNPNYFQETQNSNTVDATTKKVAISWSTTKLLIRPKSTRFLCLFAGSQLVIDTKWQVKERIAMKNGQKFLSKTPTNKSYYRKKRRVKAFFK